MLRRLHRGPQYRAVGDTWAFFEELRIGTGYGGSNIEQRIDAWAMSMWPSKNLTRIAYEVKVSRADFLKEIAAPLKRRRALLYSNLYYFITPPGLVKPEEVPIECGLQEVLDAPEGYTSNRLKTIVEAPWRDNPPPPWSFFAAIARRVCREEASLSVETPA